MGDHIHFQKTSFIIHLLNKIMKEVFIYKIALSLDLFNYFVKPMYLCFLTQRNMLQIKRGWLIINFISFCLLYTNSFGQYVQNEHKIPAEGEIAVSKPGNYGIPGATYILVNDISSAKSTLFLGKDVTLDMNGYTITYADGNYEHIPNSSFEEGIVGWDLSKAPSALIEDKKVHVFIGDSILRLQAGEEITSQYINLPVTNRSYIAMCGVINWDMTVSVFVEDEKGNSVKCVTKYADSIMVSCPIEHRSPRLGGGFVYAHLAGLDSGKYRIRVRAETDCLVDHIDIRPAMDVGIGIVEDTHLMGHNDHIYNRAHSAFFDYTASNSTKIPISGIPRVNGSGSVVIKNGVIRNATRTAVSWGIQSTADDVNVVLDNIKVISSGINATAVDVPYATIVNCSFNVDNPFIINRHGAEFYAVDLRGEKSSEVSFSEFHGGQGCLAFKGDFSKIHHNFFANKQTVTNHYSIMAMGDSSQIFENRIEPEIGSGIEVYVHRGMEIFNNDIRISTSPPTCEYGHEEYSTAAIRIADYNAEEGSPSGCFGNKVYNNKITITSDDFPEYTDYIPMAWAVFYSASAGDNYIFGNQIEVTDLTPGSKNEVSAFYIVGRGGEFYDNQITTNVPAVWIATPYGRAINTKIFNNKIIKSQSAESDFKPVRMGWSSRESSVAENIRFVSNVVVDDQFSIDATNQPHSYSVLWKLTVQVTDKKGNPVENATIRVLDKEGLESGVLKTLTDGSVNTELMEYYYKEGSKYYKSPYTLSVGKKKITITLDNDRDVTIVNK
jgi:hypothetical protein